MTQRDRDKSVEQWLRQTPVPGAQADDCLDAETLAAWAEGVLDGPQRATAEAHASNCARCQAMLAVMVRTTPVAAASTGSPIRKWLMMLGPPMAAAAAVALWFAVGQEHRTPALDSLAKAKVESAPSLALPSSAPPVPNEVDRGVVSPSSDAAVESRERAAAKTLADARKERESPPDPSSAFARRAPATEGNEKKDLAAAKRVDAVTGADRIGAAAPAAVASLAPPPPPPAAPRPTESVQAAAGNRPAPAAGAAAAPPPQQANQAQNQAQNQAPNQNQVQTTAQSPAIQRQQQALEERVIVADKPAVGAARDSAAASRSGGRGGVAGGAADEAALSFRAKVGDFELAAAASPIRWRVVDGRTVQRSPDAGATWSNQYTAPDGVFLTAGTAPSATVCWLVGRAGAVVLFRDGAGWQRVTFPEAVDLATVSAPDARTATVTTVDGRRFATADGGRTWTRP